MLAPRPGPAARKSGIDVRSSSSGPYSCAGPRGIRRRAISAVGPTIDIDAARRETPAPAELPRFEYDLAERSTLLSDLYRSLIDLSRTMGEVT
ncbi:MAG: hypothetical protein R2862_01095 [Thermoanaerobaculia bacterium]